MKLLLLLAFFVQDPTQKDATDAIGKGDFGRAVEILEPLCNRKPGDVGLWYLLGYARNRLELWADAEDAIRNVINLRGDTPNAWREHGIAAIGLGEFAVALDRLAKAGDDAESEFARGMANMRLKKYEAALTHFDRAAELDPGLIARVKLLRAQCLASMGKMKQAEQEMEEGYERAKGTLLDSPYRLFRDRLRSAPRPEKFRRSLSLGFRYNDNVAAISDDAPFVPNDLSDEEDFLFFARIIAEYDLLKDDANHLVLSGVAYVTFHNDLDEFNVTDLRADGRYTRKLGEVRAGLNVGGGYTWIDNESFRSSWTAGAFVEWNILNLGYSYQSQQFLQDVFFPEEDRDGPYHSVRLGAEIDLAGGAIQVVPSLTYDIGDPDGASVHYDAVGGRVVVVGHLSKEWILQAGAGLRRITYDEEHVRTFFTEERKDTEIHASIAVTWRLSADIAIALDYQYLNNRSNIEEFFEYDQNAVGLSVLWRF